MADQTYQPKVYREQGGNTMVVASGGKIRIEAGGVFDTSGATGIIHARDLAGNLGNGYMPLGSHLFNSFKLSSAENFPATGVLRLTTTGTPVLALVSSGDITEDINWASAVVVAIKLPPIALPVDLSTAGGLTLELYGETMGTASATDAQDCFDIRCWSGIGDTEMGITHPNFSSTPSWQGITIASGDLVVGAPISVLLNPQPHALRPIRLYDMRARYVRST